MIYETLTNLSLQIKKEKEKVNSLLVEAEKKLLDLGLDISVEVEMSSGSLLHFGDEGLTVSTTIGTSDSASASKVHWSKCSSEAQMNAVFALKPLLERVEEHCSKLLSDLQAVQELAEEVGITSKEAAEEDSPIEEAEEEGEEVSAPETDENAANEVSPPSSQSECVLPDTVQTTRFLRPFRRFGKPTGPAPDIDDKNAQTQYAMKLLLWYFTHTKAETGYESVRQMVDAHGVLRSRAYNAMPFIKKNFSYLFSRVTGKPVLHDIKLASSIDQMFELGPEEKPPTLQ